MLVPFENIIKLMPADTVEISGLNGAMGPISAPQIRSSVYDPTWGYFLFGQALRMNFHEVFTYVEEAEFTLNGEFTINAEDSVVGSAAQTDDVKFNRCIAKYNTLEAMFTAAGLAAAPANFSDWGTSVDPRCIPLPAPLLAPGNKVIYCLPGELNIEPGLWGNYIRYKATMKEAKFPSAKFYIDNIFIDGAVVSITFPKPIMNRSQLVGCAGEIIQVQNYSTLELDIQGTISGNYQVNHGMTELARQFSAQISQFQYVNMGIQRVVGSGVVIDLLWPNMALDEGSSVELNHADRMLSVSVKAKAIRI